MCLQSHLSEPRRKERETTEGQKGRTERVTDKKQQGHSKGDITKTKKNKKGEGWGES